MTIHTNNELAKLFDMILGAEGIRTTLQSLSPEALASARSFAGDVANQASINAGCLARTLASANVDDVCPHDMLAMGWVTASLTDMAEIAGFIENEAGYLLRRSPELLREEELA